MHKGAPKVCVCERERSFESKSSYMEVHKCNSLCFSCFIEVCCLAILSQQFVLY
uniref:Uncharacterized protein n=1 Tax=Manihot esculenta TaxID=3983 RepID=A0A2C9VYH1_MANES